MRRALLGILFRLALVVALLVGAALNASKADELPRIAVGVVLVTTFASQPGTLDVVARQVGPWRKLSALQRCERLALAYLIQPPLNTDEWHEPADVKNSLDNHGWRRSARCIVVPAGGRDA